MADSFQLKAIITGVNKLSPQLTTMQKDLRKFKGEFKDVIQGTAVAGAAITAMFAVPVNQAIEFESTMADVKKVVDFDSPEQFKQMAEDVLDLSTKLPMAATGIGAIVAAGGQAGIARDELLQFAEGAIKMGIAFDQTAEQSGQMMAQWRTAFKMTQDEVITLADKVNYLGNTGPANAAKIADIVTRTGLIGSVAGAATGEMAALGATIGGMGVESEVAATGIKNFMLSLTAGKAATASQKKAFKKLGLSPKKLAADMQKDAKGTMLKVLDSLANVPEAERISLMTQIFGKESLTAIAPLLTNLDLLKENFNKVTDKQQYSGSMQKEYAARAATTANALLQLRGMVNAASISIGDLFLPAIVKGAEELKPLLKGVRQWIKDNPELIKTTLKLGVYLMGVAVSVTAVTKAIAFMNFVTKMSPFGRLLTLLIAAGGLIVANWDTVGPVFNSVWEAVKPLVDAVMGMEGILAAVAIYAAGSFATSFISGINKSNSAVGTLNGSLKTLFSYAGKAIAIAVAIEVFNDFNKKWKEREKAAQDTGMDVGQYMVEQKKKREEERGYHGFIPRIKEILNLDKKEGLVDQSSRTGQKYFGPTTNLLTQREQRVGGEIVVKFDNAPPEMNVVSTKASTPSFGVGYDVGYSRFASR